MTKSRVVIVGAGPGGLAAAMQLAKAGAQVTILEKQSWVGGRTATLVQDGFKFDIGPTFFLYPRVLNEIFSSVGYDLASEVPMVRLDPQYRVAFDRSTWIDATSNVEKMESQIRAISPQDAGVFSEYMRVNRKKLAAFRPVLEMPFNSMADLVRPSLMLAAPHLRPWRTLGTELASYFKDPRLAIAFSFQSKYLGMSPFKCPSLFSILSFLEYEYGVMHPYGGCGRVSERMAEIAQELGVEIRLNEPVTGFQFSGRRPTKVLTDQHAYPADSVIINADFGKAMSDLVPDHLRKRWTDKKIATKKFSCSTFMMYLGIQGSLPDVPHHSIHIAADYQQNLREIEDLKVIPKRPSFYVHNASVTDPSLAPAGHSALYVLVPMPHATENVHWDDATIAATRDLTFQSMEERGFGDLRSRIVTERIITPKNWEDEFGLYRGATFNLAHNLGQMLHLRPHNRFEDLDSVYLVGGGTHPGSGLPVIYESSRITSKLIAKSLRLDAKFMQVPEPSASHKALQTALADA